MNEEQTHSDRSYTVTFDRIGRSHDVSPLKVTGDLGEERTAQDVCGMICREARKHCISRNIEVDVDFEEMRGCIYAGMRQVGSFRIEEVSPL